MAVRCIDCILSNAVPGITFDEDGRCSFCHNTVYSTSERGAINRARAQIADLFKVRGGTYDAIACNSGGKDSSFTLKIAVERYGLKVLSFTLDNGFISDQAFENIRNVVDVLGVDHVTLRPSKDFIRAVIRASAFNPIFPEQSQVRISAGCNACISLVNTSALRMALEKRIPTILAGFTLGQIPSNAIVYRNHFRFLANSRKATLDRMRAIIGDEVDRYYGIPDVVLDKVESYPHNVNLLCLEELTEDQIVAEVEKLGWKRPRDVDGCSSNCRLNTFNNYVHSKKFGFSPYDFELSQLIRKGLMARDEALSKVADQPLESLSGLAEDLKLSEQECEDLQIPRRGAT